MALCAFSLFCQKAGAATSFSKFLISLSDFCISKPVRYLAAFIFQNGYFFVMRFVHNIRYYNIIFYSRASPSLAWQVRGNEALTFKKSLGNIL